MYLKGHAIYQKVSHLEELKDFSWDHVEMGQTYFYVHLGSMVGTFCGQTKHYTTNHGSLELHFHTLGS